MSNYVHQKKNWPNIHWDHELLVLKLSEVRNKQGRLLGRMESLGFDLKSEALLQTLTNDALSSSQIEGESLDSDEVRSSIARKLGMNLSGLVDSNSFVDGIAEIAVDATKNAHLPLTKERLFQWHHALFPTGFSGVFPIAVGQYRKDDDGPMQVVSDAMGFERVHFEAPHAKLVKKEMKVFLKWFNQEQAIDPVLKAGLAHFWFVTVHPFDDGNGIIARAIADMQLARSEQVSQRFYSMSTLLLKDRKKYYEELKRAQKGGLDVTEWLVWFLDCLKQTLENTEDSLSKVLSKARFWKLHAQTSFNARQVAMINILFDDFSENLTTSKWAKMQKCSQDSALRDVQQLLELNVLQKDFRGGRSTNYILKDF